MTSEQFHSLPAYSKTGFRAAMRTAVPKGRPQTSKRSIARIDPKLPGHTLTIYGLRTVNPLNNLKHWRKSGPIRKAVRDRTIFELSSHVLPALPVTVQIHRFGVGKMDAWDGLPASLKPIVDGIADAYGEDDDNPGFDWLKPTQEQAKFYAVRVTITHIPAPSPAAPFPSTEARHE